MAFFKKLISKRSARIEDLRHYVNLEYAPAERDAALERLIKEAGL